MTRSALSIIAKVPVRTIDDWENGRRTPRDVYQIARVARALDTNIEQLLDMKNISDPEYSPKEVKWIIEKYTEYGIKLPLWNGVFYDERKECIIDLNGIVCKKNDFIIGYITQAIYIARKIAREKNIDIEPALCDPSISDSIANLGLKRIKDISEFNYDPFIEELAHKNGGSVYVGKISANTDFETKVEPMI